jgi:hypothetical protein
MAKQRMREKDLDLVSESDYGGEPLETVIKQTMIDLRNSFNQMETYLMNLLAHDEISIQEYTPIYATVVDLIDLTKELKNVVRSFKPAGFTAKLCSETLAEHMKQFN